MPRALLEKKQQKKRAWNNPRKIKRKKTIRKKGNQKKADAATPVMSCARHYGIF